MSTAVQFTNPSKVEYYSQHDYTVLPQADPDGTFSPPTAEGTWVMCLQPGTKNLTVTYSEPRLLTFSYDYFAEKP